MPKGERKVKQIEKAFVAIHERNNMNEVSIRAVKSWLDDNTRDGMTLMRLANFLSKRPAFKMVRRERKVGTTETESFWTMPHATKVVKVKGEDGKPVEVEHPMMPGPYMDGSSREGWVVDYGPCKECGTFAQLNHNSQCDECYIASTAIR